MDIITILRPSTLIDMARDISDSDVAYISYEELNKARHVLLDIDGALYNITGEHIDIPSYERSDEDGMYYFQ